MSSESCNLKGNEGERNVFDKAADYDFSAVTAYVESGNPVNICNDRGDSLLTKFLQGYIEFGDISEDEERICAEHDDSDYDFWDYYLSQRQKKPLEERKSSIVEQLDWFLKQGADLNLCDLSACGMVDTPLSVAVTAEDYYLTEYLLKNGADPKVWLFDDYRPWMKYEEYLIEHMDIGMMESKGEQFDNQLRIAALLAHYGLDEFGGACIAIDKERRIITRHTPEMLF